jgi:tetratricopeptide (TPR) repeat protein
MTSPSSISAWPWLWLLVCFSALAFNGPASAAPATKPTAPSAVLLEAKSVAATIEDRAERTAALAPIIDAQIAIDPAGARETLKIFPRSPKKLELFTALAASYAETGNIQDTERIYADIVVEDQSSRAGKKASATALGQVAIAYAVKGDIEQALNTLARVNERFRDERPPIIGIATARLAEAQAKHGDLRGALQTALTILDDYPAPFMRIIRDRSGKGRGIQDLVAGLDEKALPYAQWGIMQAQMQQGRLMEAQVTASTMKPGPAKAGALRELAAYHAEHRTKPLALVLLQEAEAAARATPNHVARAESLRHIAAETAMAGDAGRAISIAQSIEQDEQRRSAILDVANAQARRGEFAGAFNSAGLLKGSLPTDRILSDYEMANADILVEMVKAGKGTEAKDTAATFQDAKLRRSRLYSRIAMAYADLGDVKEAKAALALAETSAQRTARRKELRHIAEGIRLGQEPPDQTRVQELWTLDDDVQVGLDAIARALARKGDLSGAMAVADELNQPAHRLDVIRELSTLHVQGRRKEETLRWARGLSGSSEKVYALVGIATGLWQEAEKRKPKNVGPKRAASSRPFFLVSSPLPPQMK